MRFVDTSFWFGLQHRNDPHHSAAAALAAQDQDPWLTSTHVVGETWTIIRRRLGHRAAVGFLDRLHVLPHVEIAHVDAALEADAWVWLRRHDEREYSFVDATSFAMMRHRSITEALAFAGDFSAAGFVEVRT